MKTSANFSWLNFVPFSKFDLWDTKRYTSKQFESSFTIVKLGSCIKEENKKYKLSLEPEKEFGILGVNNKEGIFDAYLQKGKEINQSYKRMQIGWLAYNPYRINVGSIGVRKSEHLYEYISPAYVVFSCKENLLPEFLFLLFKTETYNKVINENTTGSVRQNLTVEILKNLEIPLPTLAEQQKIVDAYESKINEAKTLEVNAESLENEIERYLFEELGINLNTEIEKSGSFLKTISFSKIDRWAIDYLAKFSKLNFLDKGKYKLVKLRDITLSVQYGLSEKASKEKIGIPMLRMNNIFRSKLNFTDLKYLKISSALDKYTLDKEDLLFNRTNSKELVGKTAVFKENDKFTFASYLIRVKLDHTRANVEFINILFNSKILQIQKDLVSRQITGQANINAQEMQDFLFPLPSLAIQNKIVTKISEISDKIESLNLYAEKLRLLANEEFENTLFIH